MTQASIVEIQDGIMRHNDELAARLRRRFAENDTLVVNFLSSPGAGKTTLLQETLRRLREGGRRVGALVGDQATENDAVRLRESGAPVKQITTAAECRLDASMIERALEGWDSGPLDVLFIENVGNLICPAEYDLGEGLRVVLFSVTEGEDKPLKYPLAFNTSQVALITKIDLANAVGFDRAAARLSLEAVHPQIEILELSARTGEGMNAWIERVTSAQPATAAVAGN